MFTPWISIKRTGAVCALALVFASGGAAAKAIEYTISCQDAVAGRMIVQTAADGRVDVDYSFRDNGRGPDMRESFTPGPLGAPSAYEVSGRSTFGAEIKESFSAADGRMRWTSRIDSGDEAAAAGTLFLPLENTQAYIAQLLRSLLQRPDRAAPVVGGHRLVAEPWS